MPNQAIRRTPHPESTAGPCLFLMGPRPLPQSHPTLLPLSHLPQPPSHQFFLAWCPLTTLMHPLPSLLHPRPSSKQVHRPPPAMLHLHTHLSLKPTPPQEPLVELLSPEVGTSPLPPSMSFPDQAPPPPPAVVQTPYVRRTPWAQLSRRSFPSLQTSMAYPHKQVTSLGLS